MKESQLQTLFARVNRPSRSEVYELKITKTGRLPFARLAPHQEYGLLKAEGEVVEILTSGMLKTYGLYHKLSDMSADRKPFDSFYIIYIPAYVVICFYQPRKPKILYFIRIKDFIAFRDRHTMKSMTEEDAKVISERTLEL